MEPLRVEPDAPVRPPVRPIPSKQLRHRDLVRGWIAVVGVSLLGAAGVAGCGAGELTDKPFTPDQRLMFCDATIGPVGVALTPAKQSWWGFGAWLSAEGAPSCFLTGTLDDAVWRDLDARSMTVTPDNRMWTVDIHCEEGGRARISLGDGASISCDDVVFYRHELGIIDGEKLAVSSVACLSRGESEVGSLIADVVEAYRSLRASVADDDWDCLGRTTEPPGPLYSEPSL